MAFHRNLAHVALLTALMAPLAPALAADKTVVIASRLQYLAFVRGPGFVSQ